jgi:hypothetical protein
MPVPVPTMPLASRHRAAWPLHGEPAWPRDGVARLLAPGVPLVTLFLAVTAQLADLATFGVTARALGPAGELGPLGALYRQGGFDAVAFAKVLGLAAMLLVVNYYARRIGGGRRLALLIALAGVFGALTNVLALV